jgi:hypothetical protein
MTFSIPSLLTCGKRHWRFFSAGPCLLAIAASSASGMSVHARPAGAPAEHYCSRESLGTAPGYLIAVGATGFRFAPPPPVATERPIVAPVAVVAPPQQPEPAAPAPATPEPPKSTMEKVVKPVSNTPPPKPVIPDDTPAEVHPEDILPYFKLPKGERGSIDVPFTPASPNTLPKSAASYELQ